MSAGMLLLTIAAVLVFCGLLQRVLDRMHLTDRQALVLIGAMLAGTFLPDIVIGPVSVNLGGAVVPLGVCIYLFLRADEAAERWRSILGTLLTAAAVYTISKLLPAEAETLPADPMWLYGLCGGVIAWVCGRSRRAAFICGVVGILLADLLSAFFAWADGYNTQLLLGGGGIADATVISGMLAVLLCELIGEAVERIASRMERRRGDVG